MLDFTNLIMTIVKKTKRAVKSTVESPRIKSVPKIGSYRKYTTIDDRFMIETAIYKIVERNIKCKQNTLLLGPTGVGKTEMVSNIAASLDLPLTIFDMGTMTDPIMSLVGMHVVKSKGDTTHSEFVKSRFSEVIQKPGIVLLDELSRANAMANNLLFPCLDFRRELSMEYCFDDTTPIKVHPDCIFFATANLGAQYTGTHKLDRALVDRFMVIEIDSLTSDAIEKVIASYTPTLDPKDINTMVTCYTAINASHEKYEISFNLSLRHLKLIAGMVSDGFTIYDSFFTICKGIGGKDGLKAIEVILNNTKPSTKTV